MKEGLNKEVLESKMKHLHKIFVADGACHIDNFLDDDTKELVKEIIFESFKNDLKLKQTNSFDIEDDTFHQKLLNLRVEHPQRFDEIYLNMHLNARFRSIFINDKMLNIFAEATRVSKNSLFVNGFMLRLDAPLDKRNTLDWHQDSSYYRMSYPYFNSGVCWMSVTKNTFDNGALIYVPNSHSTFLNTSIESDTEASRQLPISISNKELKNSKYLEQEFGDISLLHMNLKHRSGINTSNKFRITMGCRFHAIDKAFNNGKEVFKYSNPNF
jgi:ectoine hydroxylase-related dioxygenase (phytanoyl-CoA dioxygenase family)